MKLQLIYESIELSTLKKHRIDLSDDDLKIVNDKSATWGDNRPAIWKANINGKIYYFSHTHRTYSCNKSLIKTIKDFHDYVKESS